MQKITLAELDTFHSDNLSAGSYISLADKSINAIISGDSLTNLKGTLLMAVLANDINTEIENGNLSRKDNEVKVLLKKFEAYDYYVAQQKTNDVLKLAHYACEGRYEYIFARFKKKWYYYLVLITSVCFVVSFILNITGRLKWRYRILYNYLFAVLIFLIATVIVIFKNTCDEYVKPQSFYGIHVD